MKSIKVSETIRARPIEMNEEFRKALDLMENTGRHVFITGRAGTGKSTLLECFRNATKKKVAVLAPTGVAAVNVHGMTIHSFFRFRLDTTPHNIRPYKGPGRQVYKSVEAIVIDEISMVRADLLDCIDRFLRMNRNDPRPFGGVKMIFFGDLYQLPPVVTGKEKDIFRNQYRSQYFFDSNSFSEIQPEFIELEKVYRQKDQSFINILNSIRNNSVSDKELEKINTRLDPSFEPGPDEFFINLTTTNRLSAEINEKELSKLDSKLFTFKGEISGKFDEKSLPTEMDLKMKEGSQVMLLNNDPAGRWVNGTVGRITGIEKDYDEDIITVKLASGKEVYLDKFKWEMYRLTYNSRTRSLESEVTGTFTQYPVNLAWAVTIHKGQGKTFDRVIIDIGKGTFTHGQAYVALSRCTSLEGIVLRKPIEKKHIFMDWGVVRFLTRFQYSLSDRQMPLDEKIGIIKDAIKKRSELSIVYLKANDEKSRRTIRPTYVGEMEYLGRPYTGIEAYCCKRKADRLFRVDRILEIEKLKNV